MAWGLWNKIKQGFKKVGAGIKKAADWVTNKVIKPFKPFIAGAASAISPAAGAVAGKVMDTVERFSDDAAGTRSFLRGMQEEGFTPFKRLNTRRFGDND